MLAPRRVSGALVRSPRIPLPCSARSVLAVYYSTEPRPPREFNPKRLDQHRRDEFATTTAKEDDSNFGIYVKPWDGIKSIAEAFAVLRGVEKHLGHLREYKFVHDPDLVEKYQSYFAADLTSREAWKSIPEGGMRIKVTIPAHDVRQPGGIALNDLSPFLVPEVKPQAPSIPRWKGEVAESAGKEMEVVVERSRVPFKYAIRTEQTRLATRSLKLAVGRNFLAWGGFATPLPRETPVPSLEDVPAVPASASSLPDSSLRPHMQTAWGKWHAMIGDNYPVYTPQPDRELGTPRRRSTTNFPSPESSSRSDPEARPYRSSLQAVQRREAGPVRTQEATLSTPSHTPARATPPTPTPEPTVTQLADRERRKQMREAWSQFSYPMPGTGAATAAAATSASAFPQTTSATPEPKPQPTVTAQTAQKASSRKDRLRGKVEGKDIEMKPRSTVLREEEAVVEDEKTLSKRIVDLFGRWKA